MAKKSKKSVTWQDVKKLCRLSDKTICQAQKLGMSPQTVRANHASTRSEKWKSATADWIQDLYEKRFGSE
ncbi:hypothetical protein ACQ4M3_12885 [Leptolyngbya sp. AN03gr2]|uniref:hypothetical protein n=1 Tax=unclassified Leptolyngbya TaxID=2650499 RepID=UPI003D310D6C